MWKFVTKSKFKFVVRYREQLYNRIEMGLFDVKVSNSISFNDDVCRKKYDMKCSRKPLETRKVLYDNWMLIIDENIFSCTQQKKISCLFIKENSRSYLFFIEDILMCRENCYYLFWTLYLSCTRWQKYCSTKKLPEVLYLFFFSLDLYTIFSSREL